MITIKRHIFWLDDLKSSLNNIDESTERIKQYLLLNQHNLNDSYTLYFNFYRKSFFLDSDKRNGDNLLSVKIKENLYVHYQINNHQEIDFDLLKKHIKTSGEKCFRKLYQDIISEKSPIYGEKIGYFKPFEKPIFMFQPDEQMEIICTIFQDNRYYEKVNLNNIVKYMNFDLDFQKRFLFKMENDRYFFSKQFEVTYDFSAFTSFYNFDKIVYQIILFYIQSYNQKTIQNDYKYLEEFIANNSNKFNHIIQSIMFNKHDRLSIDQLKSVPSLMKLSNCDNYLIFFNLRLKENNRLTEFKKDFYIDFIISDEQLNYHEDEMKNIISLNGIIKNKTSKILITIDSLDILNAQIELAQIKYKNLKIINNDQDEIIVLKNHLNYLKELKNVLLNDYIEKVENYTLLESYDVIL